MTLILTNDDGIDAPGIQALLKAVDRPCLLVAPQKELSGCGHQVTTHRPIHVQKRSETAYAVGGTPADCTRLAITHIAKDVKYIISGINPGGNMGADIYISGTVAAVREAAFHRIPGIAISQYRQGGKPMNWEISTHWAALVLTKLLDRPIEAGSFWNVNLPYLEAGDRDPDVVFCSPGTQPLPVEYRVEGEYFHYVGEYAKRDRAPGTDVDVCFSGNIAVTQLRL